ncbi:FAD-dependent oxidoreductase [Rhodobacteraceae bacterium N5(2021)]|uniref:FAD-dependent oxidoreductase n=1 Tax=Gymnodinialimonas phycosphaerae TaxID=2841589 RepID=A0A975TSI3_9RHOB|nr:FAD-dependent oxidoreductase [Gymnodinialimonas phycosphaerae]MBY4894029.1 FAD-dependent oxidoreductase [Gymnodinialimonas phycosphaerae]
MTDTVIVGAGLCGLAVAEMLEARGADYLLVEARDRTGGRILSVPHGGSAVDMGPAWFWPGQPRIAALTKRLGLRRFDQFSEGALSFEDETGAVQRGRGYASMAGSWRLEGGLAALTDALTAGVPTARLRKGTAVTALERDAEGVILRTRGRDVLRARRVVLALPPRLVAEMVFDPMPLGSVVAAWEQVPTWMAGQAKAVAIYPTPFWRDMGLSGDAMSRHGPMVEIHDASPDDASFGALFGFIGVPPSGRVDDAALRAAVMAQFGRLFGGEAPLSLLIHDWAASPFTATAADAAPLTAHPTYGLPKEAQHLWDGRVILSGTETARGFGGYLEGALEAAEAALVQLEEGPLGA